jgi:hypothetical protein
MKITKSQIRSLISEELKASKENQHPYTLNFLQPQAKGVTAIRRQAIVDATSENEAISRLKDRFPNAKRIMVTEAIEPPMTPHEVLGTLIRARYRIEAFRRTKSDDDAAVLTKIEQELIKVIDALPSALKEY